MKRYNILGEPVFDLVEAKDGYLILFEEFENFILARIKELEEVEVYGEVPYDELIRIDELKNLIKYLWQI